MNEHINKGEIEAARAIQYDADRIIYKMCEAHGNLYAVQKEILRRMYGLELGGVREPMPGLIPEDEPIVAEAQAMIEAARAIQYDADRIIYKMCEAHGNLYAVQKEILRRMYGLELGGVREPMPGLIPEDEAIVAEAQAMIEAAIAKL